MEESITDNPMILLHVEWMEKYQGLEKLDNPTFYWPKQGGEPHESFNFRCEKDNLCYGYVQVPDGKSINIKRLGDVKYDFNNQEYVDNVNVVWIAKHPNGGLCVVGWYLNAFIYRYQQSCPIQAKRNFKDKHEVYSVRAAATDAYLVTEKQRDHTKLTKLGNYFKRAMQFYISKVKTDDIINIEREIWEIILRSPHKRVQKKSTSSVNAKQRKLTEDTAI